MPPQPFLYVPFAQRPIPKMTLIAQTEADPANAIAALRDVVRGIDINVPVYRVETMEELFEQRSVAVANLLVGIATTVGLVGLCLALIGLYAIVLPSEPSCSRDRHSDGRRRLRAEVLRMILKQAAVMGIAGVAIGTVLSFAGGRGLTLAMGMPSFDPLLLSVVPIALFTTTVLAALVPARRASSIDPQEALRHD